jgi:hypothetical protein
LLVCELIIRIYVPEIDLFKKHRVPLLVRSALE